ncbi:MAG: sigma-54-dependent Fis family transcriptional regulator [Lentisphaerae bacterium]|jgi:DNA-binding NtrC family response regulator|nr:sigma-54-dependent Fis family transcriptional regulator [Lentisphaerota bacterium]MBT4819878.1 sigma-54-dependent Fis family transcriptional regulator [Lentisphaerota bacterium]MBT5605078.1 sigma-54-dependent Fis family transcriptional regulator [Lentisphaerota bacterium]MBT7062237.1 sigma-54-dependent Fis family transcriptional regulator [Lentisphaerota bacterium]MBT7847041.1 sigma-54-dependent Fis family transcriptional regulator [Lentisphaerota bacterium]
MAPTVLVIDDEVRYRQLYAETLRSAGYGISTAGSAEEAEELVLASPPDMIVSDVRMPGMDGIQFLKRIAEEHPLLPCLLITAYADIRDAVKALKLGAVDYLEKPVDLDELVAAVGDTLDTGSDGGDTEIPADLRSGIVAESPIMQSVLRDAYQVSRSDATVLLTGESGCGKEVLASFIHRASPRADRALVALNCAALPAQTLASELFGHERGAFTGAIAERKGVFRNAHGGTLFLDEIGDMPLDLQPSLLRAIEAGEITPLGSDQARTVDFRLIAATNRELETDVEAGRFRQDLFYRVNVFAIAIPPLRERPEDILPLARHFLGRRDGPTKRLSPASARRLQGHAWPGNTRELANAIERAAILASTDVILPENLPPALATRPEAGRGGSRIDIAATVKTISQAEGEAIRLALNRTDGNRTKAAELLGISRRALIYKLKRLGI